MCEFCNKIWSSQEEYSNSVGYPWDEIISIVVKDGELWLYVPIEDSYYSDTYLQINYCPKCGRKLMEEKNG